ARKRESAKASISNNDGSYHSSPCDRPSGGEWRQFANVVRGRSFLQAPVESEFSTKRRNATIGTFYKMKNGCQAGGVKIISAVLFTPVSAGPMKDQRTSKPAA
ncbi:MAG TPA: hypothetical protein VF278_20505, partial [Pirellulales bacterium]